MFIKSKVIHPFRKEGATRLMILKILLKLDKSLKVTVSIKFSRYILCKQWTYQQVIIQFSGCSYFAARSMVDDAELVFCPYSYIINPVVRRAMEVNITGAIIILDEAQYV